MLAEDPWEWRAVWISGLAALDAGDFGAAQSAFNAVYGQVPGELAPKLALALACEHGGEGDVAEGLYRTCAQHRRQLRRAGRVRPGPDPRRPPATSRERCRRSTWCRRPAASFPEAPPAAGRACCYESGAGPAVAGPGDGQPARASGSTRASRRSSPCADPGTALAEVEQPGPKTGCRSDRTRPSDESLRDGLEATYRQLAGTATDDRAALRAGRQGQRRAKVDPAMTRASHAAGTALRCPNCGAEVTAEAAFCEACGTRADADRAPPADDRPDELESPIELTQSLHRQDRPGGRGHHPDRHDRAPTAAAWSGRTATARPAAQGAQRARPLHRAAGSVGRRLLRPGHPALPQRGRDRRWPPVRRPGSRAVLVVCDGVSTVARLRRRQPGRRHARPGRARRQQAGRHRHPGQPGRRDRRCAGGRAAAEANAAVVASTAAGSDERRLLHVRRRRAGGRPASSSATSATAGSTGSPTPASAGVPLS